MALELDGRLFRVVKTQHVKPGKGGAYMQTELKDMLSGSKTNKRFRVSESLQKADLGPFQNFQYLYTEGDNFVLMHETSFEQIEINKEMIPAHASPFLDETMKIGVQFYNNEPLAISLPDFVTAVITKADPATPGMSFSVANYKPVVLENGQSLKVPPFLATGDTIKIDLKTGEFVERV